MMIMDWKQDLTEYIQYMKKKQDEILKLCGVPRELMDNAPTYTTTMIYKW